MMDELTGRIVSSIQEAVASGEPAGISSTQIWVHLAARDNLLVSRETVSRWLRTMHDAHQIELRHGLWVTGPAQLLAWDKPPQAQPHSEWAEYEADGAPPGTYQPN